MADSPIKKALAKIVGLPAKPVSGGQNLPAQRRSNVPGQPQQRLRAPEKQKQLTNAAMVYAVGAGVLFMLAIYNMTSGSVFNGVMILVPAGSLLVLAYKYLQ